MNKALAHDRAEIHLKMFRSIDTEYRKLHWRTLSPNTQRHLDARLWKEFARVFAPPPDARQPMARTLAVNVVDHLKDVLRQSCLCEGNLVLMKDQKPLLKSANADRMEKPVAFAVGVVAMVQARFRTDASTVTFQYAGCRIRSANLPVVLFLGTAHKV